jgi:hypothetical protein
MKKAALAYAARGWRVLPIEPNGKKPLAELVPHGCKDATDDPETIKRWWTQHPNANVGIASGAESGFWALDLDGLAGIAEFNKWTAEHGETAPTHTVSTPGGGLHIYFKWPVDRVVGNRAKINGKPIDARGESGYVLAPTSIGPNGKAYVVDHDVPLADAPAWLLDRVAPKEPPPSPAPKPSPSPPSRPLHAAADLDRRIRAYMSACPPAVSGSGGHNTTYTLACALIHGWGLSAAEALPYLAEWNQSCAPPWSERELKHKLADAESKGSPPTGRHRGYLRDEPLSVMPLSRMGHKAPAVPASPPLRFIPAKPWKPFPVEVLPAVVRHLVEEGAAAIGIDCAYVAVLVLPILAGCIGNARRIRLKRGWEEPSPIWAALVAESGSSKSPALDLVAAPLHEIQAELFEEFNQQAERHKAEALDYAKRVTAWKSSRDGSRPPIEPPAPICERIVVADTTIEKLGRILQENARGIIIVRDELAAWFGSMDQYRPRGGADIPKWIEFFGARPSTIDRQTGGTLHIKRACVSIAGTIQPAILSRSLTAGYRESGLAARILLAMPPKRAKRWTETEADETTRERYAHLLRALRNLPVDEDAHGDLKPVVLHLSVEAKAKWIEWYDRWGMAQAEASGDLAAAFSKLEGYAARFAMVRHTVEHVAAGLNDCVEISVESIRAGIALAEWFAHEVERVYTVLAETDEERELRRLVDLITRKGGHITARDLQRAHKGKYPTVEVASHALRRLTDAGLGTIAIESPTGGGHAHPVFKLTLGRQTTLDLDAEDADPPAIADTRNTDPSNSKENGASVGPVVCRLEDTGEISTGPPATTDSASVGQDGEDREVFEL